jgi:hypothetical protein
MLEPARRDGGDLHASGDDAQATVVSDPVPEVTTIGVSIDRDWRSLYETVWRPETFPLWASGLTNAPLKKEDAVWKANGPEGPIEITFTGRNTFGVMDHWVDLGGGHVIYVPLRVIQNGSGAHVLLTLFRQLDMTDAKFAEDVAWVERDLSALKTLAERP